MLTPNAVLDRNTGEVYPSDTGAWTDAPSTWDAWNTWYLKPTLPMVYLTEPQDYIFSANYNLKLETTATGTVSYEVYSTNTDYVTDLTTTTIAHGATDVAAFSKRFFVIAVIVDQTVGVPVLQDVQITVTNQTISEIINIDDTSTLSGSITARALPIKRVYSYISNIDISARAVTAYNLDLYVSNYATSTTVIPRVVSRNRSAPTMALLGIDGSNQDGGVDVTVTGLPMQYMSGNNLYIR